MTMFKRALLLTALLVVGSCATKHSDPKVDLSPETDPPDLVKTFDVEKEQAESFKIKPLATAEEAEKAEKAPSKAVTKKTKAKSPGKTAKKSPAPALAPAPTVSTTAAPVVAEKVPSLPADYSELFKEYDVKSQAAWDKFKPVFLEGEESTMAVTYLGVTAGHITILSKEIVSLNDKKAFHYFARFKSNESYSYFYWLDDRLDSYVEKDTFLPIKYTLIQREKKQNVDDLQLFDFKKMMTYNWYKRVKKDSDKNEKGEQPIPRLAQDSFSVLQFVRGLPLLKNDVYEFPVVTRGKIWLLKVEVLGEETIEIEDQDVKAIKVRAETHFPGVLKKTGDTIFWYGTGPERKLLKFQAKIKIGSIYGELVKYKPGNKVL